MNEFLVTLPFIVFSPFGWMAISKIENQFAYITTMRDFFGWKLIGKPLLSMFIGVVIGPFCLIYYIVKHFFGNKAATLSVLATIVIAFSFLFIVSRQKEKSNNSDSPTPIPTPITISNANVKDKSQTDTVTPTIINTPVTVNTYSGPNNSSQILNSQLNYLTQTSHIKNVL